MTDKKALNISWTQKNAGIFIPDGSDPQQALKRTTHLGIGAHPDDLEFMCAHPILECYEHPQLFFTGIILSDGGGSLKPQHFSHMTEEELINKRHQEQMKAAQIGKYSAIIQLHYKSSDIKNSQKALPELDEILSLINPIEIYTHTLTDKHPTHVATALKTIESLKKNHKTPQKFYGCEVWRTLDWMNDTDKILLPLAPRQNLLIQLMKVFETQLEGGKNYDEALLGRKSANATFFNPVTQDPSQYAELAMDLKPLLKNHSLTAHDFAQTHIQNFENSVLTLIQELQTRSQWKS